jgi:hypothetical protein
VTRGVVGQLVSYVDVDGVKPTQKGRKVLGKVPHESREKSPYSYSVVPLGIYLSIER